MSQTIVYSGKTHTTGGRDGASRSSDGELEIALSPPGSKRTGSDARECRGRDQYRLTTKKPSHPLQ